MNPIETALLRWVFTFDLFFLITFFARPVFPNFVNELTRSWIVEAGILMAIGSVLLTLCMGVEMTMKRIHWKQVDRLSQASLILVFSYGAFVVGTYTYLTYFGRI